MARKEKDFSHLINTINGNLTILKIYKKEREYVADCLCSCGNTTTGTSVNKLLKGQRNSCKSCSSKLNGNKGNISRAATSKYNNLIGKQVHYFTVLGRSKEHPGCFDCKCVCGNIRFLDGYELTTNNDRKSCGCQQSRLLSLANGGNGISNDGVTINEFIRKNTLEYTNWVKLCLEQNKYTCFVSGQVGGQLNVHHVMSLADILQLYGITKHNYLEYSHVLFNTGNGVVLSQEMHKQLHNKYGKSVTIQQLIQFKNDYLTTLIKH